MMRRTGNRGPIAQEKSLSDRGPPKEESSFRTLLEMSPNCMERISSSSLLLNTNYGMTESPQQFAGDDYERVVSACEVIARRSISGSPELEELSENLVKDVLDNQIDTLLDAKRKNAAETLSSVFNLLSTHDVFRRAILRSVDWKLESCLSYLTDVLTQEKGAGTSQSVASASVAARFALLLIWCLRKDFLSYSISGTSYEKLAKECIAKLPKVNISTKNRAAYSQESAHFAWLCFALLGSLIMFDLVHDEAPNLALESDRKSTNGGSTWLSFFDCHASYILKRKETQLVSAEIVTRNADFDTEQLKWKTEEVIILDGAFFAISVVLAGNPHLISTDSHNRLRPREEDQSEFSKVRRMLGRLSVICQKGGIQNFVNCYCDAMASQPNRQALGLPHLLGICFEYCVGDSKARNNNFSDDDCRLKNGMAAIQQTEEDHALSQLLDGFCRRGGGNSSKVFNKALGKEIVALFRDVHKTTEGERPKSVTVVVDQSDVLDTITRSVGEFKLKEARMYAGLRVEAEGWIRQFLVRCCREFCGDHSSLATARLFEDLMFDDCFRGRSSAAAGSKFEERQCAFLERQHNRKCQKQTRKFDVATKTLDRMMN